LKRFLKKCCVAALALPTFVSVLALAAIAQKPVLDAYAAQAKVEQPDFAGFSAERGRAFFLARNTGGSADTPSCTTCHTADPTRTGQLRTGKDIAPMAVSKTPDRFTDPAKVEKWFTRNCQSVLGRACTAAEKGDFITFMSSL
jgi:hypothetical protein